MLVRSIFALAIACLVTDLASAQQWRPCGPGLFNNALVPQNFAGVDFRCACEQHDRCYGKCGLTRKQCDGKFLCNLLSACKCSPKPCLCRMKALQWFMKVRLLAGVGYHRSQQSACCSSCCEDTHSNTCCGDISPEP